MATETTLGARILDAARDWGATGAAHGWHRDETLAELAELRALCARADAAERLAVALSPLGLHICDDEPGADEVNAAMEAWWALGEVG
ncbi:MAG: hypothetical protein IPJ58_16660 [Ardenticatenia bacterium]|nr:hypothetical protein [Ardenticatenia bacterium]